MFNPHYEERLLKYCCKDSRQYFNCEVSSREATGSDRFIPCRSSNSWQNKFFLKSDPIESKSKDGSCRRDLIYQTLLQNELLGTNNVNLPEESLRTSGIKENLFQYNSENIKINDNCSHSRSPLGSSSQKLLQTSCKSHQVVSQTPLRILDAPYMQDDFYLSLVDWSAKNVVCVGLDRSIYLWNALSKKVEKLCALGSFTNIVTSVLWNKKGNLLAIGSRYGDIEIWDITAVKQINRLRGHTGRVGALSWNGNIVSSGGYDSLIIQHDIRSPDLQSKRCLKGHKEGVCGLKWSPDFEYLASGGNDNLVNIWSPHSDKPVQVYEEHKAAVKAISWSPHQHGILATGGGTDDKTLRFWNVLTGQSIRSIYTGSQVCNVLWSQHSMEFVSTHGYSQNLITLWKYPSLRRVINLTGHSSRVLYLSLSPDAEVIVTGAGDETLRFWKVFDKSSKKISQKSALELFTNIR